MPDFRAIGLDPQRSPHKPTVLRITNLKSIGLVSSFSLALDRPLVSLHMRPYPMPQLRKENVSFSPFVSAVTYSNPR